MGANLQKSRICGSFGDYQNSQAFINACEIGDLEIIIYLINEHNIDIHVENDLALRIATEKGNLDIVKYFIDKFDADKFECAKCVFVKCRKENDNSGCFIYNRNKYILNQQGFSIIKYLINLDSHKLNEYIFMMANRYGFINTIKYLIEKKHCASNIDNIYDELINCFNNNISNEICEYIQADDDWI